jgi:teichuronic acid biosynthesis glycosyltransferase TuaH
MTGCGTASVMTKISQSESKFRGCDIIFVSLENWDEVWRRNQFLCAALAKRFPQMKILFVGLPRNVSYHLRHGSLGALRGKATYQVSGFQNITTTHALKLFPDSIIAGQRFNGLMARKHIRSVASSLGMRNPILWLNPHSAVHMAGKMNECAVIYDITDDWAMAPSFFERERKLIIEQDRSLCAQADLVIVCSEALEESRRTACKRLLLLPNGVDSAHYASIPIRSEKNRWEHPVFGYTGTIHADRFDVELVAGVARSFPEGSIVLVGPNHLTAAEMDKLALHKNIHITGPVSYSQIPEVMSQFDVCIVPHVETKFTNSLNPLKLWEYLAAGKPIVSTNVAGFRSYPHLCRIATGVDAFVQECRKALEENGANQSERRAEAQKHSWDQRVEVLLNTMAGLVRG